MDAELRKAWTMIVTPDDYEQHMLSVGQAEAGATLTRHLIQSAKIPNGGSLVIVGAGTGQMFDFLDATLFLPYRLTCTDLSRSFLNRLEERLVRLGLTASVLEDDIEVTALTPGADLLLATLVFEHIDWRRGADAFIRLRPAACGIIIQENHPDMIAVVTPGRRIPASIAMAMETAHPVLLQRRELVAAFESRGYELRETRVKEVADGKRLVAVLFECLADESRGVVRTGSKVT